MKTSPINFLNTNLFRFITAFGTLFAAALMMVAVSSAEPRLQNTIVTGQTELQEPTFPFQLANAAEARTLKKVSYDPAYRTIAYPMGDVEDNKGVCTDVIIRSYRALGTDLQQLVHEDMKANFGQYPRAWGLSRPDKNIDHRRVLNLETFFSRHGEVLETTDNPYEYQPGDLVTWRLGGRLPHIGVVSTQKTTDGKRPLIVHNVGGGTMLEDVLFNYPIFGHYRYSSNKTSAQ